MLCNSRASRADNCSRSSGDSGARSDSSPARGAQSWLHSRDQYEVDASWGE